MKLLGILLRFFHFLLLSSSVIIHGQIIPKIKLYFIFYFQNFTSIWLLYPLKSLWKLQKSKKPWKGLHLDKSVSLTRKLTLKKSGKHVNPKIRREKKSVSLKQIFLCPNSPNPHNILIFFPNLGKNWPKTRF